MRTPFPTLPAALVLALMLLALAPLPGRAEVPRVATDIAPVQSLAARVMAGLGTPDMVVRQGASPHGYAMRPSEARALARADLVFWVGPALTPWLAGAVGTLASEARAVDLLARPETQARPYRTGAFDAAGDPGDDDHAHEDHGHDDHGHEDHGHEDHGHDDHGHDDHGHDGHGHAHAAGGIDAHAWLDPENGKAWLDVIAAELARADPANAARYAANARAGKAEIDAAAAAIAARLAPLEGLDFVVFHDAYQYFEARFGLSAAGAIALSDAADPGPARIAALRDRIAARGVTCAFAEPQFDPGILRAVLAGRDATIGVIDPLGGDIAPGPDFYVTLLDRVARAFAACG